MEDHFESEQKGYTYVEGYGFVAPQPPHIRETYLLKLYASGLGFAFFFYFLLQTMMPLMLTRFFALFVPEIRVVNGSLFAPAYVYQAVLALSSLLSMLFPFLIYMVMVRMPFVVACPSKRPSFHMAIPAVFITLGVSTIGNYGSEMVHSLLQLSGLTIQQSAIQQIDGPMAVTINAFHVTIVTVVLSEMIFHGIVMQSLRRFGDSFALMVSSILFALSQTNLERFTSTFLFSLCVGYFVIRTGSIWTGMMIHFGNNLLFFVSGFITDYLSQENAVIFHNGVLSLCLLLALVSVLYLLKNYDDMFTLVHPSNGMSDKRKLKVFFLSGSMLFLVLFMVVLTVWQII